MLQIAKVSKVLGGREILKEASFKINSGEKIGLVGKNGAGKSTLMQILIKELQTDSGEVSYQEGLRVNYFSQKVGEMQGQTALAEVITGDASLAQLGAKLKEYEEKLCDPDLDPEEMNKILEKMGDVQTEFEKRGGYDVESRAEEILTGLGIFPEKHQNLTETFSGGQKMRIALAKVLVTQPDLILMDEPTNYLDLETIEWLEVWLKNFSGSLLMTTHDRTFMNNVVNKIVELDRGDLIEYSGNYDFFEKEKKIRLDQLKASASRQQDMLAKEEKFIAKFKARASHAAQVQSRVKKLDKIERIEVPQEEKEMAFIFPDPPRGSDKVVQVTKLSKSWDGVKNIFSDISFTVSRLEKIAVVGVNGIGKSTLLKCLVGETSASSGEVKIGASIKIGYFGQYSFENFKRDCSVEEYIHGELPQLSSGQVRNLLAGFLFTGDDVLKSVKVLSGGEKARLVLAVLFSQNNNFLVLDEPTNHLDLRSREILLETLKSFKGTLLFVSHDRFFLNELSEKVVHVDNGDVKIYPGNYSYYLEKTKGH